MSLPLTEKARLAALIAPLPSVYAGPDRFDLDRAGKEALTFGRGVKSCPGMHLARKNMTVALQILVERLPGLRLIDPVKAEPRRTVLRCPEAVRVRRR